MPSMINMDSELALQCWSAWSPAMATLAQWQAWAAGTRQPLMDGQPALAFVPALARRRMSRLTRMAMQVAHDCAGGCRMPAIFASRHGELARTTGILQTMVDAEPVSPADFSVSVHNTAAGLYAIQQQDRSPATAISAGERTLAMAWVEAAAQLHCGADAVLLVYADEPVPLLYRDFVDEPVFPLALALRLCLPAKAGPASVRVAAPQTDAVSWLRAQVGQPAMAAGWCGEV